jgi:hypothetical protein
MSPNIGTGNPASTGSVKTLISRISHHLRPKNASLESLFKKFGRDNGGVNVVGRADFIDACCSGLVKMSRPDANTLADNFVTQATRRE